MFKKKKKSYCQIIRAIDKHRSLGSYEVHDVSNK